MIKITIEGLRDNGRVVLEYEQVNFTLDQGIVFEDDSKTGMRSAVGTNGQRKLSLTAWTGCQTPESFQAQTLTQKPMLIREKCPDPTCGGKHYDRHGGEEDCPYV